MPEIKWRDVFDCEKLLGRSFNECQEIARSVNYKYMCFNGLVYSTLATSMEYYICSEENLVNKG